MTETLNLQEWQTIPEVFEGVKLTRDNAEAVARWCGGAVNRELSSSTDVPDFIFLAIPNLSGARRAEVGDYVARSRDTGCFSSMSAVQWQDRYSLVEVSGKHSVVLEDGRYADGYKGDA